MPDPRAALLEAIQKRTYIATVPCHCVDANLNHWPDCTCDHGKRYEERSYDFYALLAAALEEARREHPDLTAAYMAGLERGREEQAQRIERQSREIQQLRTDASRMLRRGMKAIHRLEWEKGETAQEWYDAAGTLAASYELAQKVEAAILRATPEPAETEKRDGDACRICDGQGCLQELGRTCPECKGSGRKVRGGERER